MKSVIANGSALSGEISYDDRSDGTVYAVSSAQPVGRAAEKRRSDGAGNRGVLRRAAAVDSVPGGRVVPCVAAATAKKNDSLCGVHLSHRGTCRLMVVGNGIERPGVDYYGTGYIGIIPSAVLTGLSAVVLVVSFVDTEGRAQFK